MYDLLKNSEVIPCDTIMPAVSQGAIGIQCRSDDKQMVEILAKLNHKPTELAVECERGFLSALDGNCRTPIAAQAVFTSDGALNFIGMIAMCDGSDKITVTKSIPSCATVDEARKLGNKAGKIIIERAGPQRVQAYHDSMFACNKKKCS